MNQKIHKNNKKEKKRKEKRNDECQLLIITLFGFHPFAPSVHIVCSNGFL